ncbi:hypothetical protein ACSQ67_011869 [Phaseolus vulgaris]
MTESSRDSRRLAQVARRVAPSFFCFDFFPLLSLLFLSHGIILEMMIPIKDVDWQDNDGALNTITMTHLLLPIEHPNRLVEKESDCKPLYPGIRSVKLAPYILFSHNN